MSQPEWKLIAQHGDASPIDHGGFFIYEDTTGVYDPDAEVLEVTEDEREIDTEDNLRWTVYRFSLERCTFQDGILSDNCYHPEFAAWWADDLPSVASSIGQSLDELITLFCSPDARVRAVAYQMIGEHLGYENLDHDPLHFRDRRDVLARYK